MKKMIKKLLNTKMKFAKNQKGLTLIELLVVIVILGIIAAVAIPAIMSNTSEAKLNSAKQTNSVVRDAAHRYAAVETYDGSSVTLAMLESKKYFQETPTCPPEFPRDDDKTIDLLTNDFCTITETE